MLKRYCVIIIILLLTSKIMMSQHFHDKETARYECVSDSLNEILFLGDDTLRMYRFISKLDSVISAKESKLNILHIGGSHVQADVFTNRIRNNFNELKEPYTSV